MTSLIIDGSIWLYKNSIALKPLYNVDFIDISVVYYTLRKIYNTILKYKPDDVHIVFDIGRDIKKKEKYEKYKESRNVRKIYKNVIYDNLVYERLSFSRKILYEILYYTPIKCYLIPYVEGDTLIAMINNTLTSDKKLIYSIDKDMLQLLDDYTIIISTDNTTKLDKEISNKDIDNVWSLILGKNIYLSTLIEKYNLIPISFKSIPYYRAFLGDVSDDIPGIKNIGIEIISYLIQYQQYKNKTNFINTDDFISFFIDNKDDIYVKYKEINKLIYDKNKKSTKKLDKFYDLIQKPDVVKDWKLFFELMDFDYSIKNLSSVVYNDIIEKIRVDFTYDQNNFIKNIQLLDLHSTNEYIKWDIINNILVSKSSWNVINNMSITNISNFEILFNSVLSKCSNSNY